MVTLYNVIRYNITLYNVILVPVSRMASNFFSTVNRKSRYLVNVIVRHQLLSVILASFNLR